MVLVIVNVNYYSFSWKATVYLHARVTMKGGYSLVLDLCVCLLVVLNWALKENLQPNKSKKHLIPG